MRGGVRSPVGRNNRPGRTGGRERVDGEATVEKGHLAVSLSLCDTSPAAGCNLMSFLCWFRL